MPEPDSVFSTNLGSKVDVNIWAFDALILSDFELVVAVKSMFEQMSFMDDFKVNNRELVNFTWRCHYYYSRNKNAFHNFYHGVNVCHGGCYFLQKNATLAKFSSAKKYAFVVACLCHDLDHRGKTNSFESGTKSDLAIRYLDNSPLENHHVATMFSILNNSDCNIFKHVADDQMAEIKKNMIENILATDMKQHIPILSDFKKKLLTSTEICILAIIQDSEADSDLVSKIFIKCADISGSAKPTSIATKWSRLVAQEFSAQVISYKTV